MEPILQVNNLHKRFQEVKAVNGISFSIDRGKCLGLLGPNGAGKTTTVEMLEGIRLPDQGEILYKGKALGKAFRGEAGIMFQSTALQEFITVREILKLFGSFYPRTVAVEELIETCALQEFLGRDSRQLSGGQRQRLLLAIALINDPEILFLDEPTTGLDPQARHNFWALIQDIKQRGKTIVLTTHYMEEAYVLCDDIAIVDHGKIIAMGTPQALLEAHFDDVILCLPPDTDRSLLEQVEGVDIIHHDATVELRTGDVSQAVQSLLALGIDLSGLKIRERTLEDLFLELTGKELRQ